MAKSRGQRYDEYVRADEDPDAPHNRGLPSLRWRRPDPKSKTGLESLESDLSGYRDPIFRRKIPVDNRTDVPEDGLRRNIEAIRAARELGYKLPEEVYDPAFLAALMIKEGRADLGGTDVGTWAYAHNKKAMKLYEELAPRFGEDAAGIAALMYDKGQVAKRIKKPFPMVWNGVGEFRRDDNSLVASGKNYARRFPEFIEAAKRPENRAVYDFMDKYLNNTEYSTPLPKDRWADVESEYQRRQDTVRESVQQRLNENLLRRAQYALFGSGLLGVPEEMDPKKMAEAVPAPDYEQLRRQLKPNYATGGNVENTTHYRKIL